MKKTITVLWLLNLFDAVSTMLALATHRAREGSPLMRWAYEVDPSFFYLLKMSLATFGCWVAWRIHARSRRITGIFVAVIVVLYTALAGHHVHFWYKYIQNPDYWAIVK